MGRGKHPEETSFQKKGREKLRKRTEKNQKGGRGSDKRKRHQVRAR